MCVVANIPGSSANMGVNLVLNELVQNSCVYLILAVCSSSWALIDEAGEFILCCSSCSHYGHHNDHQNVHLHHES